LFLEMGEINKALLLPILNEDKTIHGAVKIEKLLNYLEIIKEQEGDRMKELMEATRKASLVKHEHALNRWQNISKFFQGTGTQFEQEVHYEGDSRVVATGFPLKAFKMRSATEKEWGAPEDPVERFWRSPIDWENERLHFDPSPLTITGRCFASKIQFLFTSTKATCLFVQERGKMIGCVTTVEFLKQKFEE